MNISEDNDIEDACWRPESVLREITAQLRHDGVTHLVMLDLCSDVASDVLAATLRPFSAVTSLLVISGYNYTLRTIASIATDNGTDPESQFLPALRDLTVGCDDIDDDASRWNTRCRFWWDPVLTFLKHRQQVGLPLHTLRINGRWKSESLRQAAATEDVENIQRARELVEEVIDDRTLEDVNV